MTEFQPYTVIGIYLDNDQEFVWLVHAEDEEAAIVQTLTEINGSNRPKYDLADIRWISIFKGHHTDRIRNAGLPERI